MTNYLENLLITHVFRTSTFTKPTALSVALFTAVTDAEAGTVTEVTGGSYARVAVNPLDANWSAASGNNGTTSNVSTITFPQATADWGTVTHFGIHDGTNWMFIAALTNSRNITNGTTPSFAAGTLTVQIDN
ncbi:MAG: hypothetical protein ACKO0Z_05810 [Betaproteobacteria bacterium]